MKKERPNAKRDMEIYAAYKAGASPKTLRHAYMLGRSTIGRIIYWGKWDEKVKAQEAGQTASGETRTASANG